MYASKHSPCGDYFLRRIDNNDKNKFKNKIYKVKLI